MSRRSVVTFVVVGVGGAVGTLARYGAVRIHPADGGTFPWATLAVNLLGAALIGALAARGLADATSPAALAVSAGFLGAFTTFSGLAVETVLLVDAGRPAVAGVYLLASVIGGLAACAAAWRVSSPRSGRGVAATGADRC